MQLFFQLDNGYYAEKQAQLPTTQWGSVIGVIAIFLK